MNATNKNKQKNAATLITLALIAVMVTTSQSATDLMQQTKTKAKGFRTGQPPANWEYPFKYEDTDIVKFVTDDLLLNGTISTDLNASFSGSHKNSWGLSL